MKVTTQDVLTILPFDNAFKQKLLSEWDSLTEDQRFELEGIIWDTYADIYQIRLDTNTQIALQELSKGNESMDSEFGQRIQERTDDEFEQVFQHHVPAADLVETREKLQDLIANVLTDDAATGSEKKNNESNDPSSNPSN